MQERQLLTLFQELERYVGNRDERGSIVGYSLATSLLNFSTSTGAREEVQFEQVRAVYTKLEEVIRASKEMTVEQDQVGFQILCALQIELHDKLNPQYLHNSTGPGDLGRKMAAYLHERERGYEDRLRRTGLSLCTAVERRGILTGKRSTLLGDYESIAQQLD